MHTNPGGSLVELSRNLHLSKHTLGLAALYSISLGFPAVSLQKTLKLHPDVRKLLWQE